MNVEQRYRFVYKPLVFIASLSPIAWVMLRGFGVMGPSLGADPAKLTLHLLGKTALNMLMITLMVTPVRHLTGNTHIVRIRRMLGLFVFFYASLHFLAYLWLDKYFDFPEIAKDIVKRPYITIGFLALLMLIPLAVTSTNKMMRRLGRRWQTLHRLVYIIAILGVWHYYWQVKKDVREPLIYAGILAILLGYRVVRARLGKHPARRPAVTSKSAPATAQERT
ncbi:MAG: protein-methionine-sulfoxide reductase heme-binding subunit MsrQ [Gammaproteobacteria bacterium]